MRFFIKTLVLCMVAAGFSFCAHAADNLLLNPGFESYDSETMVPDSWTHIEGRQMTVSTGYANEGDGSLYLYGGHATRQPGDPWGTATVTGGPSPPSGAVAQVIDLSTIPGWGTTNWLKISYKMYFNIKNCRLSMATFEYLPSSYDAIEDLTADNPVWNSDDVVTMYGAVGRPTRENRPWEFSMDGGKIPIVRWARLVVRANVEFKCDNSGVIDANGNIFAALDDLMLTAESYVFPLPPQEPGNLLLNGDFEAFDPVTRIPDHWHVLKGMVTAMDTELVRPVSGEWFIGHPGGLLSSAPREDTEITSSLVQVVDMSTLPQWAGADSVTFSMGLLGMYGDLFLSRDVRSLIEYLPQEYNDTEIAWDSDAWENHAKTPIDKKAGTHFWKEFKVPELPLPKIRWVRIRLEFLSRYPADMDPGKHASGFLDRVCFTARAVVNPTLIENPGFETLEGNQPRGWHSLSSLEGTLIADPANVHDGDHSLGLSSGTDATNMTVYQVIDLKDRISFWNGGIGKTGDLTEYDFMDYTLSAQVANMDGVRVSMGIEHLPYSYNKAEDIAWDDPAWQPSQWVSDGEAFTNNGGNGLDSGLVMEERSTAGWHGFTSRGWLPKARWLRLRIEMERAPGALDSLVAIDNVSFSACCRMQGPYSGYGPDLGYYENPDAIDKGVPGWLGPEGIGNCGGYTGQSKRNYVNPAFAGFADDYQNYITSGQEIGMSSYKIMGANITGPPFTDAGWAGMIVTLGDMDLGMLADYFGPAPSGDYQPGEITAVFNQSPITNGDGPDFACFENGFITGWNSPEVWAELSFAEVSTNGVDFIRFPTHSLTPKFPGAYGTLIAQGLFGFVGKHVNAYGNSFGTPFDLDWIADHELVLNGTVDLNDIRYVRMVDIPGGGPRDAKNGITGLFKDSHGLPVLESWLTHGTGGADLDAVGVLNTSAADTDGDGISDYWDNCPDTPNPRQFNTNKKTSADDETGDTYGNACDCDLNQDDVVDAGDYTIFRNAWGSYGPVRVQGAPGQPDGWEPSSSNWNPDVDFNGDFKVNGADFQILKKRWGQTGPFK